MASKAQPAAPATDTAVRKSNITHAGKAQAGRSLGVKQVMANTGVENTRFSSVRRKAQYTCKVNKCPPFFVAF